MKTASVKKKSGRGLLLAVAVAPEMNNNAYRQQRTHPDGGTLAPN